MDKHELLTEICEMDKKMTALAGKRNNYLFGYDVNSVGRMLDILSNIKGEAYPTDLCHIMGVSTPRITIILNMMEKDGLIERSASTADRRRIIVSLTKKGREKVQKRDKEHYYYFEKVYEKLGRKDTEALLRSLQAMEEIYEEAFREITKDPKKSSKELTKEK